MKKNRVIWASAFTLTLLLYFFENNTGTRILTAAAVLVPPVTVFCAWYSTGRLKLVPEISGPLQKGQPADLCFRLEGPALLYGCSVSGRIRLFNPMTGDLAVPDRVLKAGENVFEITPVRCGSLMVRMTDVKTADLLGLFEFPVSTEEERTTVILPCLYPVDIPEPERLISRNGEEPDPAHSGAKRDIQPFGDIREYVPGDPVRRIHWKLSEKTGRVLIRENELLSENAVRLFLNPLQGEPLPERIDRTAEALLSLSRSLKQAEIQHSVCWADPERRKQIEMSVVSEADFLRMEEALLRTPAAAAADGGLPEAFGPDERTIVFDLNSDALPFSESPVMGEEN